MKEKFEAAFVQEAAQQYPVIDEFEKKIGFSLDRSKLEAAAKILACPVKRNPPNWQHGRVLYSLLRSFAASYDLNGLTFQALDIGTAKGFSALCMKWALLDAQVKHRVASIDVIDPHSYVSRNTVAEVNGLKSLPEILAPWTEARAIDFYKFSGIDYLRSNKSRIHFVFIDGKHSGSVVAEEGRLLRHFQSPGDLAVFDDVHLHDVQKAVEELPDYNLIERINLLPNRAYAIMVRN